MPAAALATILLSMTALAACSLADTVIGVGQNIHHDDFEYSVQNVETIAHIGDKHAKGLFHVVTFRVENRARRVEHRWGNDLAYLVDERGVRYENDRDAQRALDATRHFGYQDQYVTPAGAADTTMFVFDLPRDANEPYLKVRGWFLMGDLFDGNRYKRTKVKLF